MPPPYRRALTRVLALTLAVTSVTLLGPAAPAVAEDIPKAPGHRLVADYQGAPATASPAPGQAPPQHPYLAPNGRSGMHADAAGSGTHPYFGPLGRNPDVVSEKIAPVGGECATATFDSGCDTVWESAVRSPSTVPKLSTANGLLYFYEKEPNALGVDAWYLTAVDFRTGERRWRKPTGTGPAYDNNWAPITIGPDGTAYADVLNGIVAVRDTG